MLKCNNKKVDLNHFPDGTLLIKEVVPDEKIKVTITWLFENNEELLALIFLTKHLRSNGINHIELQLPYIPNARQDRVKNSEDVFTLKYFSEMINSLEYSKVVVLDPHSYVSQALINNIDIRSPKKYVERVIQKINDNNENILVFYPDEGAMKRYSSMLDYPYVFGIKKRDWETGEIQGLEVSGQTELIEKSTILIVDDICSKGGTFYHSARKLKELGADKIILYISHCENTILKGKLLTSDLLERVYTTNSIFTEKNNKVEVFHYE